MFCQPNRAGIPAHKVISAAIFVLLLSAAVALPEKPAQATTVAGRTAGTFAVSPTGAASYTIPIWAPPGPNGMQPHIALTYNSRGGNGYVGVGWGVSGLSSIYRCNLTLAQDAAPGAVALNTSDGYCMDGQRLRLTSGTYGVAGSTYQTEIANFINVTAYGSAGNGPAYWIAQDRNGRSYTYGNGGNSQVLANGSSTAISWMLNEVSDPPGNTMTVAYSTATGTAVPATISWTPASHGSSSYNYTMTFAYGTNVVPSQGHVAGTAFTNANLLSSITIAYSGTTVKKYVLSYQASPTTGRDELKQVQECSDSGGTNCLLPTQITYQNGTIGISSSASTAVSGNTQVLAVRDFNGDGLDDILFLESGSLYVAFATSSGYSSPVAVTSFSGFTAQIAFGDLLGKGQSDILVPVSGTYWRYTWNGSSFSGSSTGISADGDYAALVDANGDGLADLVTVSGQNSGEAVTIHVRLNTGNGSSVSFGSEATLPQYLCPGQDTCTQWVDATGGLTSRLHQLDFDGDGRADLVLHVIETYRAQHYYVTAIYLSASTATTVAYSWFTSVLTSPSTNFIYLNANDDRCTDMAVVSTLWLAPCNGTAGSKISLPGTAVGAVDWDGDGRDDLLVQNGSNLGVMLSTGNGMSGINSTSIPLPTNLFVLNRDGDGLGDLGVWTTSAISTYEHNGGATPPDLLASVTDGYGNSASPTYVSLADSSIYYQYSDATYPDQNFIGPLYVVQNVTFSDPSSASGGTYNQEYFYYGAWTNLQGRGFEGFYATESYDSRNGVADYEYFERLFPYTGMHFQHLITTNWSWYPIETSKTLAPLVTLSNTPYEQRYFAYFGNSTTYQKEVNGSENGDLITTTSTNFTYDNYGNPTTIATTVTDNDPNSPYLNQTWTTTTTNTPDVSTSPWCLGLLTQSQVAYSSSLSGSGSVTRTKTFSPDTTNCRYTQIVTEPNSSQFKVTEALGYDGFGNVNSDSVTGIAMGTASPATRATQISWTNSTVTTGQFPMTVTDPSGAQTQLNYNFSYGLKSSLTDPNNITTSWQYTDGFGRLNEEIRADGTYTTWNYYDCAASTCLIGNHGTDITHSVYGVGGGVITDGTDYLDPIDRQIVSNKRTLASGTYDRNELRYDSLGRLSKRAFPCTWSSLTTTCSYWTTNSYDVLNRLAQSQRPISSTNSNPQTTTYAYAGRTTTVTDPQSNARVAVTDVNGWFRQTKDPMGYTVTLAYDSAGSKTKVTDSLGNTLWTGSYNYGLAAYLASATDMDMGAWSFTIDALGEKTAWTDANSKSFSATYDALSRPLTRTDPATLTDPGLFSQWTWGSSASSHNIWKLQSECTGTGTSCASSGYSESETYDSLGRRSQRSITISGYSTFNYTWAYNPTTGLLNTLTYPTSTSGYALELQYAYANGVLQSVTDASDTPNVTVWTANAMDPAGHVTEETLGVSQSFPNGIVTNRFYDPVTQWLGTAQSGVGGGAGLKNLAFLYDDIGNVIERQDNNLGLTENIYYDNDYRFSYSKLNGTQNLSVTYDATGNITSRSDVAGGASWTYDPNHKHEVTQAGSSAYQYSYDANGNAIARQGSTISWSSYNYPTTINAGSGSTAETVAFSYGPDRQRWQQMYTGNSTQETTNYVGGLMEVVASGGVTDYRHYINVAGEQIAVYSRKTSGANTFSYLLSDHQASVASITNSSGTQVVGESFTAFGSRRNPTTWSGAPSNSDLTTIAGVTREGYTFQTALGLWMGMNHMNGRVQDSITGRFLSADPSIPNGMDPQSYNPYSYVNNNPLSFNDPSGFVGCAGGSGTCLPINPSGGGPNDPNYYADQQFNWSADGSGPGGQQGDGSGGGSDSYFSQDIPTNNNNTFCSPAVGGGYNCANTNIPPNNPSPAMSGLPLSSGLANPGGAQDVGGGGSAANSQKAPPEIVVTASRLRQGTCAIVHAPSQPQASMDLSDAIALAGGLQSFVDASAGTAMHLTGALPTVTRALGGAGGVLSVATAIDGFATGNTYNEVFGTLDTIAFAASFIPGAQVVTGPYFVARFGMEVVMMAYEYSHQSSQGLATCGY